MWTQVKGSPDGRSSGRFRITLLLAVLALVVAACGDAEEGDTTEPATDGTEPATDETQPDDDGDGTTPELSVWFAREYFVPPQEHLDRFEDEAGVTLNVDVQPADDLFQQLIRMNDAGEELPDIVHLDGFLRPVVAEAGVVVPIQDVVDQWAEEDPESYDQVYPATWEEGMWDGELVGMANSASMEEVYFRSDWLEEVGFTQTPETWDQVLEAARATQEARPEATSFGWWAVRGSGANHVYASMTAMGVEFDGSKPILQSDAGEYWIEFLQTLSREELIHPEAIAWNDDDMRGGFVGSNVGMMLDSIPTALDAQDAGIEPGAGFQVVPMPTSNTGQAEDGVITGPARTFHITTTGEEVKEEAGLFLRFLMEKEVAEAVMDLGGDPHRTSAVLEDQEYISSWVPQWDEDNIAAFSEAGVFPVDLDFPASQELMEQVSQFAIDNPDMDPAAVAEQWQAEFDALGE